MIIAVPVAEVGRFHHMGRHDDYYDAQIVWWHFWCTTCGYESVNRARFSHPESAIERGENHHLIVEQCDTIGQLALFAAGDAQ